MDRIVATKIRWIAIETTLIGLMRVLNHYIEKGEAPVSYYLRRNSWEDPGRSSREEHYSNKGIWNRIHKVFLSLNSKGGDWVQESLLKSNSVFEAKSWLNTSSSGFFYSHLYGSNYRTHMDRAIGIIHDIKATPSGSEYPKAIII